jgi:hypothetical protein
MSRFADPAAVAVIDLGACQCPGTPHERDEATVRWDISGSALARIGRAELDRSVMHDPFAAYRQTVKETLVSWNLLILSPGEEEDRKPVPAPIHEFAIDELDGETLRLIATGADELITHKGTLPNRSGALSAESSPESASHTRKRTPKPTTSF